MDEHHFGVTQCVANVRTTARDGVDLHLHLAEERFPIRALILEDDPDTGIAFALVLSLDDSFAADIVAWNACERAQRCRTRSGPLYDVLLLDVVLEASHLGTEVLAAATVDPLLNLPPVLICTALSGDYLATHVPELAANNIRVLLKPFDIDD